MWHWVIDVFLQQEVQWIVDILWANVLCLGVGVIGGLMLHEAWHSSVHGVAKSGTCLSDLRTTTNIPWKPGYLAHKGNF